ncbi:CoA transferase [Amycolatopsis acidicola]|uniref:CoA transferase n=1 Tax=Amycolatopsis acidicola TaxID=2596893 RepID=A0A5N0VIL7_9PSEU|nr:CoA transferase [Amycolatopsis acidicola]KAA9166035.1 CoA transferase [Amycolatopsis acidicola]
MSLPLEGIRVLDFTIMIAGPYGGRLLADAGAEVIKVEAPEGDPMRKRTPLRAGASSYFGSLNAGKRGVMLDLKDPDGHRQAVDLVAGADVLIENFRPGVMAKLGLDYETCARVNPGLVYCSISGYGQTGPKALYPAYAPIVHAMSGYDITNMNYQRDADRPASTGIFVADVMAGQVAYGGIVSALLARGNHGRGDHLDIALLDIMLSTLVYETQAAQDTGPSLGKTVYRPVPAGDEFLIIAAITDRNFRTLAEAMGRPDLLTDPRFAEMSAREHNWEAWQDVIAGWAADQEAAEAEKYLLDRGVPCARFRTVEDVLDDEQLRARGTLRRAEDAAGTYDYVGLPFQTESFGADRAPALVPALGADNEAVLGRGRESTKTGKRHESSS